MKKVLVIGAAMLDVVMNIDELPNKGEDIYAKDQTNIIGGCAFNVADILKHFKVPYTLFAPIGGGMNGKIISGKLKEFNHETPIFCKEKDNGYCLCLVDKTGERTFITLPGVECSFQSQWFDNIDIEEYDCVYISGYEIEGEGGDEIIDFLEKNKQLDIFYAPGPRINFIEKEKHDRLFNLNPIIHLNEKEAKQFSNEKNIENAADFIFEKTKNLLIITLGDKGVLFLSKEGTGKIASEPTKVIDTIGAGDSHIATVIASFKMKETLENSLKRANKVAAKVVSVKGSTLTTNDFESVVL